MTSGKSNAREIFFITHASKLNLASSSYNMSITRYRFSGATATEVTSSELHSSANCRKFIRTRNHAFCRSIDRKGATDRPDNSFISVRRKEKRARERERGVF